MSAILKLNVGGTVYTTTQLTINQYPDSMLARMIEQPLEKKAIAEGRELFIDRDGELFKYILKVRQRKKLSRKSYCYST